MESSTANIEEKAATLAKAMTWLANGVNEKWATEEDSRKLKTIINYFEFIVEDLEALKDMEAHPKFAETRAKLDETRAELESKAQQLSDSEMDLQTRIDNAEAEQTNLEDRKATLAQDEARLRSKEEKLAEKEQQLSMELEAFRSTVTSLTAENEKLREAQDKVLRSTVTDLSTEREKIRHTQEDVVRTAIEGFTTETLKLQQSHEQTVHRAIEDLATQREKLYESQKIVDQQRESYDQDLETHLTKLAEIDEIKDEHHRQALEVSEWSGKIQKARETLETQKSQVEKRERELEQRAQKLTDLEKGLEDRTNDLVRKSDLVNLSQEQTRTRQEALDEKEKNLHDREIAINQREVECKQSLEHLKVGEARLEQRQTELGKEVADVETVKKNTSAILNQVQAIVVKGGEAIKMVSNNNDILETISRDVNAFRVTIADLEKSKSELSEELTDLKIEVASLRERNEYISDDSAWTHERLKEAADERDRLKELRESSQSASQQMTEERDQHINSLNDQIKAQQEAVIDITIERDAEINRAKTLQAEIDQYRKEVKVLEKDLSVAETRATNEAHNKMTKARELLKITAERDTLLKENNNLQARGLRQVQQSLPRALSMSALGSDSEASPWEQIVHKVSAELTALCIEQTNSMPDVREVYWNIVAYTLDDRLRGNFEQFLHNAPAGEWYCLDQVLENGLTDFRDLLYTPCPSHETGECFQIQRIESAFPGRISVRKV